MKFNMFQWRKSRKQRKNSDGRTQFNFACDVILAERVKLIAKFLGIPIYPFLEHVIELGIVSLKPEIEDRISRQSLKKHIIEKHLLVKWLNNHDTEVDY